MFELNNRQKVVVEHVLQELLSKGTNELNKTFGTFTIQEMQDLYSRLHYADFCEMRKNASRMSFPLLPSVTDGVGASSNPSDEASW